MNEINSLYDYFAVRCGEFGRKMLFDNAISYVEGFRLARRRAAFIQSKGIRKGDVVALLGSNSAEWCITYMAITMCGAVVLGLDPNLPTREYRTMLRTVKARAGFVSAEHRKRLSVPEYDMALNASMGREERFRQQNLSPQDPASYSFTSGTTGKSKIVELSHKNIYMTAISGSGYLGLTEEDLFLCILPLFHAYALEANFIAPFNKGASFIFLRSLKGPDILKALKENRFTVFPAAPQLWELFMDAILQKARAASRIKYGLLRFFLATQPAFAAVGLGFIPRKVFAPVRALFGPSMKYFISGGAPLKRRYFRYYQRMGLPIVEGYGLTETCGPICISHPNKNKEGSVGPCMPGNEASIRNVNADGVGEIWLRGDFVMTGYYRNPKANKASFDDEGFFSTGDTGQKDRDGYLYITGRTKDTIVLDSGKNVYPAELEALCRKSPHIAEACVFGRTQAGREKVWAAIVPVRKDSSSFDRIRREITALNRSLPPYKSIAGFSLSFDPLPKNTTRKILAHEVKRLVETGMYQESADAPPTSTAAFTPENDSERTIMELMKRKLGAKTIYATSSLAELGLDSLGVVDFAAYCEEHAGVTADMDRIRTASTAEELIRALAASAPGGPSLDDRILRSEINFRSRRFFNPVASLIFAIIRIKARIFWGARLEHPENHDYTNSIIIANHQSLLDSALFLAFLPGAVRKRIWAVGKRELSWMRFLFPGLNILYVDRGGDVLPSLKASADVLRSGESLLIFPEGTRSRDGRLGSFKSGAAYLAKNLGKPVAPVCISGTFQAMPRGRIIPRIGVRVRLECLPMIRAKKSKALTDSPLFFTMFLPII